MAGERRRLRERRPARLRHNRLGQSRRERVGIGADDRRRGLGFNHDGRKARPGVENKPNNDLTRDKGGYRA